MSFGSGRRLFLIRLKINLTYLSFYCIIYSYYFANKLEKPLIYHHCRDLEGVEFGTVKADPERTWEEFKPAYRWLADQTSLPESWPLFMAVGEETPVYGTGYINQFRKKHLKGDSRNSVLFSFHEEDIEGFFSDYGYFDIATNAGDPVRLNRNEIKWILKPSWDKEKWLKKAKKDNEAVQLVVPELHLPDAKRIWVRNKQTKRLLENMGFTRVEVKRLLVPKF